MSLRLTKPSWRHQLLSWAFLLLAGGASYAWADKGDADKAAISLRLHAWADAFNARDAARICDLYSPDLIASVPGAPDASRDMVCKHLANALANPELDLYYSPEIHEIILSGDLAVVRLTWSLTVGRNTGQLSSQETGMDVFRRQADGTWSIIRFVAFSTEPDTPRTD